MEVETPRQLTKKLMDRFQQLTGQKTETAQRWSWENEQARDRLLLEMRLIRARWDYARRYSRELADDWPLIETAATIEKSGRLF